MVSSFPDSCDHYFIADDSWTVFDRCDNDKKYAHFHSILCISNSGILLNEEIRKEIKTSKKSHIVNEIKFWTYDKTYTRN